MYGIEKHDEYLLIRFNADFDYNVIQAVIHHLTSIKEYSYTNDIWLIRNHHADIRLGELEDMMREFHRRCPRDGSRSKTAIVVEPGFTQTMIELWVSACVKKVPFDMKVFHTIADARVWLGEVESQAV